MNHLHTRRERLLVAAVWLLAIAPSTGAWLPRTQSHGKLLSIPRIPPATVVVWGVSRGGAAAEATAKTPPLNGTNVTSDASTSVTETGSQQDEDSSTATASSVAQQPRLKRPLLARIFSKKQRHNQASTKSSLTEDALTESTTETAFITSTSQKRTVPTTETKSVDEKNDDDDSQIKVLSNDTSITVDNDTALEETHTSSSSSSITTNDTVTDEDADSAMEEEPTLIEDDDETTNSLSSTQEEKSTDANSSTKTDDDDVTEEEAFSLLETIATEAGVTLEDVVDNSSIDDDEPEKDQHADETDTSTSILEEETNNSDKSQPDIKDVELQSTTDATEDETIDLSESVSSTMSSDTSISSTSLQEEGESQMDSVQEEGKEDEESSTAKQIDDKEEEAVNQALSVDEIYNRTQTLRAQGKELHDAQHYREAAYSFALAAKGLDHIRVQREDESALDPASVDEDWATCRLHEALCHLKADNNNDAILACTAVLQQPQHLGTAVRARALYRRAKAYAALEDVTLATQDARQAAFLGDTKGVELYGQLLRDHKKDVGSGLSSSSTSNSQSLSALLSQSSSGSGSMSDPFGGSSSAGDPSSLLSSLLGSSRDSDASSSPFGGSSSPAAALLSQALAGNAKGDDGAAPFSPLSLLGNGGAGGSGAVSMVKNMISNNLDNPTVHEMICNTLQNTSSDSLQQYASAAGVNLSASQADTLAGFCQKMKPAHLKKTVSLGKAVYYVVQLVRKFFQVLTRYRPIFILLFILAWIKSLFG